MRPRLLDLFCCQGGAATGYHDAGFEVIGVDISPQPLYPFPMVQADALEFLVFADLSPFAAIHGSPPCQFRTQMAAAHRSRGFDSRPDLLTATRAALRKLGKPYVIENVPGAKAKMSATLALHGGMFGLGVHRPRIFECSELILAPAMPLTALPVGVYGSRPMAGKQWDRLNGNMNGSRSLMRVARSVDEARELMEMPWADWHGCKEAVPPAYTRHIGAALLAAIEAGKAA
jgi:DNA (cytosine-5)-methyltransferase 1